MAERLGKKFARLRIPEPDSIIEARGDNDAARGIKLNVVQSVGVPKGGQCRRARIDVPNEGRSIARCGRQPTAVGAERSSQYPPGSMT